MKHLWFRDVEEEINYVFVNVEDIEQMQLFVKLAGDRLDNQVIFIDKKFVSVCCAIVYRLPDIKVQDAVNLLNDIFNNDPKRKYSSETIRKLVVFVRGMTNEELRDWIYMRNITHGFLPARL